MATSRNQKHKATWGATHQHGVARKAELGNTNTPYEVAVALVSRLLVSMKDAEHRFSHGRFLEPCVGTGSFYLATLEAGEKMGVDPLDLARRFDAVDIDPEALAALKRRLSDTYQWEDNTLDSLPIFCKDLVSFRPDHAYDVILTNPPYLSASKWGKNTEERALLKRAWWSTVPELDNRADLFVAFFHWCHRHLNENGVSLFLCSDSWLDAQYGQSLRDAFVSGRDGDVFVNLEVFASWPWHSLFRDDTCPVATLVRRVSAESKSATTTVWVDDGNPMLPKASPVYWDDDEKVFETPTSGSIPSDEPANCVDMATLKQVARKTWLGDTSPNRRFVAVNGMKRCEKTDELLELWASASTTFGDMLCARTFPWSMNNLVRDGGLLAKPGALGRKDQPESSFSSESWERAIPVFFQKQARVGKPVNYCQARTEDMLECRLDVENSPWGDDIKRKGLCSGGAWLSGAIDRLPLVFYGAPLENGKAPVWCGLSKYFHLSFSREKALDDAKAFPWKEEEEGALLGALLTSTAAMLAMERYLKEGTRQTLRRNERGYAKEITRGALRSLPMPDPSQWTRSDIEAILRAQKNRGGRSLPRWDELVDDPDWLCADRAIAKACGVNEKDRSTCQAWVSGLYWRRMRNELRYIAFA